MTSTSGDAFRERARFEANRYGSDQWVFIRELLQNARDAGAVHVWFETDRTEGRDRILCRDDGEGMTFEHARDFLFTLYASSKKGGRDTAGRFGIGFWSVLRFSPSSIVIRSRAAKGAGWHVVFDGSLKVVERGPTEMERGTEIAIERPTSGEDIEELIRAAVLRDAPFLNRRGRGRRPLDIRVEGRQVRMEPELPSPSVSFRRRGLRGVVGLGSEPRVEVFAHGLKIRDAATLDELLFTGSRSHSAPPPASDELSPCALIDSRKLSILMARGDAREDRALRQLVAVGHSELRSLIRSELNRHARPNFLARAWFWMRDEWSASRTLRAFGAVVLLVLLGGAGVVGLRWWPGKFGGARPSTPTAASAFDPLPPQPYAGLEDRYRGPDADSLGSTTSGLEMSYVPRSSSPLFGALIIRGLDNDGSPIFDEFAGNRVYAGQPCTTNCLEVEVEIADSGGWLQLPVAAGHLVDPTSLDLEGRPLTVRATTDGRAAVLFDGPVAGRLRFRSSPGVAGGSRSRGEWPSLPPEIEVFAARIRPLPTAERARAAEDFVRRRVRYDTSERTISRILEARTRELNFLARTLEVSAGDCDVQNTMVAAILDGAGVPTRLAVGWIGVGGSVLPGLHAWVEYLDDDGRWRVVDASTGMEPARPAPETLTRPGSPEGETAFPLWALLVPLAVGAGAAAVALLGSKSRSFQHGTSSEIAGLVRGAAIRPAAFAGVHSLYARPLLRLIGGHSISLGRAQKEMRRGRLAVGSRSSDLAGRCARGGGIVVDRQRPEGVAAAEAFGAVDLDRWQALLERSLPQTVADRVEEALAAVGEPVRIRVARSVGEEIAILDGRRLGLGRSEVWVIADHSGNAWGAVREFGDSLPAQAALLFGEAVIDRLGLPEGPRERCLAELARAALLESAGSGT